MKLILNSRRKGVFCLSDNGTPCGRVGELMARGKISLALALPILFSFARPASLHYEEHVCVRACVCIHIHTHIPDGVENVYELPLLPSNTAIVTFLHKPGAVRSVDWIFIIVAPAWRLGSEYVTLDKTFCYLLFERKLVASTVTSKFSPLPHSSRRPLL